MRYLRSSVLRHLSTSICRHLTLLVCSYFPVSDYITSFFIHLSSSEDIWEHLKVAGAVVFQEWPKWKTIKGLNLSNISFSRNVEYDGNMPSSWSEASVLPHYNCNLMGNKDDVISQLNKPIKSIGPSGVRALPLAAGRKVGGHSTWHYFSSLFFFFRVPYFSTRKGAGRFLQFCMGS